MGQQKAKLNSTMHLMHPIKVLQLSHILTSTTYQSGIAFIPMPPVRGCVRTQEVLQYYSKPHTTIAFVPQPST